MPFILLFQLVSSPEPSKSSGPCSSEDCSEHDNDNDENARLDVHRALSGSGASAASAPRGAKPCERLVDFIEQCSGIDLAHMCLLSTVRLNSVSETNMAS
jgi:hypothetical protein